MSKHRHSFLYRNKVKEVWKLHRLFRNPRVKRVLIGCEVCHPKLPISIKKNGQIFEFSDSLL